MLRKFKVFDQELGRCQLLSLKLFPALLVVLLLTGCESWKKSLTLTAPESGLQQYHPPLPNPVKAPTKPIKVTVITPEVAKELIDKSEVRGDFVFFAFNEQDWLTLDETREDTIRYINELRSIVDYYRVQNKKDDD